MTDEQILEAARHTYATGVQPRTGCLLKQYRSLDDGIIAYEVSCVLGAALLDCGVERDNMLDSWDCRSISTRLGRSIDWVEGCISGFDTNLGDRRSATQDFQDGVTFGLRAREEFLK